MKYLISILILLTCHVPVFADDHIVIVMDTSGSMGEYMRSARMTRMDVAKNSLNDVLANTPASTKVAILSFGGWIYNPELNPVEKNELIAAVDSMRPSGGTPLYEYMREGATVLLKARENAGNSGTYKLLVVTDGEAGDSYLNRDGTFKDGTFKAGVLEDIISRGIVVDVIGLDLKGDHGLKTQINGSYMKGDDPDSLTENIQKSIVAEVNFDDGIGDEIFNEVSQIPDTFANSVITALTTYQNHPIGEKPPIKVVNEDGTISMEPDPANVKVPEAGKSNVSFSFVVMVLLVLLFAVMIVCFFMASMVR